MKKGGEGRLIIAELRKDIGQVRECSIEKTTWHLAILKRNPCDSDWRVLLWNFRHDDVL